MLKKPLKTCSPKTICVGARSSKLSFCQVDEVALEMQALDRPVLFEVIPLKTVGDLDRTTSLRALDKTNFFTKEVDELLLKGECRIAIHSAKDLPEPLAKGLELIALTKGVDTSDSLVLPPAETLASLPPFAKVATSSVPREKRVLSLREDLTIVDIRGTIEERLLELEEGRVQGVVIAEAALVRLGLTHLNRITLPGESAHLQGRLAIVAREGDEEMKTLFSPLDRGVSLESCR